MKFNTKADAKTTAGKPANQAEQQLGMGITSVQDIIAHA